LGLGEGCGRCSEYACELLRNMAHEQKLVVSSAGCKS
jgi:bacterioferritin-associated ferredoxin